MNTHNQTQIKFVFWKAITVFDERSYPRQKVCRGKWQFGGNLLLPHYMKLIWTILPEYTVLIQVVVKLITQNEEQYIQAIMRLNQTSAAYLVLSGRG